MLIQGGRSPVRTPIVLVIWRTARGARRIQDEKSRARTRMVHYTDPVLADAFNFYLPDRFTELSGLLNSRNSRPASKSSAAPKPHKH
jgi:hypothetical protein